MRRLALIAALADGAAVTQTVDGPARMNDRSIVTLGACFESLRPVEVGR